MSDVYQTVTDRIVAAMELAQKWEKPWTTAFSSDASGNLMRPINATTGKAYRGVNVPMLWAACYGSNQWATYRQWQSIGAQVRKGEKASQIVFWKRIEAANPAETTNDEEKTPNGYLMARAYSVFNAEQVDGFGDVAQPSQPAFDPIAKAEEFVTRTGADIRHGGDQAFYIPSQDYIRIPHRSQFIATTESTPQENYYSTLFHELTHWTRHETRLNRDLGRKRWGDEGYAAEELVAELGAAFLCSDLGVTTSPRADHAAYLASWIKVLKNDKRAIFSAASMAEKAVAFLAGKQSEGNDIQPESLAA